MIIAITGSHGFIGRALVKLLQAEGHTVRAIPRRGSHFMWDGLTGAEAVIHLAGRNIAARWTAKFTAAMIEERRNGVLSLQQALKTLPNTPKTVVIASAIGFYGKTWHMVDETAPHGAGFAVHICRLLEEVGTYPPLTRVVFARLGVVVHPSGGALAKMLLPFKLGLGGRVGRGEQVISWVSRTDACRALLFCITQPKLAGPVNVVAPNPLPQRQFAKALARYLRRPCLLPLPSFMVRLLFGRMGQELLLQSIAVKPAKLLQAGFVFNAPALPEALMQEFKIKDVIPETYY